MIVVELDEPTPDVAWNNYLFIFSLPDFMNAFYGSVNYVQQKLSIVSFKYNSPENCSQQLEDL